MPLNDVLTIIHRTKLFSAVFSTSIFNMEADDGELWVLVRSSVMKSVMVLTIRDESQMEEVNRWWTEMPTFKLELNSYLLIEGYEPVEGMLLMVL